MSDEIVTVTTPAGTSSGTHEPDGTPIQQENPIPDKFRNADGSLNSDALLASYRELEKNQSMKQQEQPAPTEAQSPDLPTGETPEQTDAIQDAADYFQENGRLDDAQYEALAKSGITRDHADAYIAGQAALAEQQMAAINSAFGGEGEQSKVIQWAGTQDESVYKTYNDALDAGDYAKLAQEAGNLRAAYEAANGREPSTVHSGSPSQTADAFKSMHELRVALSDFRYGKDPAYSRAVDEKAARSNL